MKKFIAFLLFMVPLLGETFTRDDLLDMGCYRIGDILYHIEKTELVSTDGFHFKTSLMNYQKQGTNFLKLFIDDHLFGANILEGSQINWLPIDVNSIDSVIIIDRNGFYKGEYLKDGAIQIFTKKNKQIINANFGGNWGNESGDPGPLKYTDRETENVDKIGQNLNTYLSINIDENYLSGFMNYRQHTYRDPRMLPRIESMLQDRYWIGMDQFSAGEMISLKNHSFVISQVYGKNCFYYHPQYQLEVPSDIYYDHASYYGHFNLFGISLDLRSNWENYHSEYIENSQNINIDWRLKNFSNNLHISRKVNAFNIITALDYEVIRYRSKKYSKLGNIWSLAYSGDNLYHEFTVGFDVFFEDKKVKNSINTALTSIYIFEDNNRLISNLYFQTFASNDVFDIKYFQSDEILNDDQFFRIRESVSLGTTIGGNLSAEMREWKNFEIKIGIPFNYNINKQLQLNDFDNRTIEFTEYLNENYFTASYGLYFKTILFPEKSLSTTGFYQVIRYLFDDHFDRVNNEFIMNKAVVSTKYKPSSSFSSVLKLIYWKNNFQNLHYISYPKRDIITIDVSLIKYFWNKRCSSNFMIKNLMNNRYWLHQEGIAFDRSMYFGVNFWL
ncbi:MAG: hypothetical protein JXQ65_09725 [Candidatus Marinimicrobia bacterium]|nr:hypothetical protein [Candidatus Neomarinimicrobiota bacterium]